MVPCNIYLVMVCVCARACEVRLAPRQGGLSVTHFLGSKSRFDASGGPYFQGRGHSRAAGRAGGPPFLVVVA